MVLKRGLNICSGLDALALAKRNAAKVDGMFKVPRGGVTSVAASLDEEEKSTVSDMDEEFEDLANYNIYEEMGFNRE